jgi:hypothetical protein
MLPDGITTMLRSMVSALALAGILATAQLAFADALATATSEHTQADAPATEQQARPVPAKASSPDATRPTNTGLGKDVIPVGFGWG